MRTSITFFTLVVLSALLGRPVLAQSVTAITHVTVIDPSGGARTPDQTVVIRGRRISTIGRAEPPAGATVVDGRGKFLIPGLWDLHVHTTVPGGERLLGIYVANGVTGVRDMNDSFATVKQWRGRIAAGTLVGPRIVAAGPYLEGGWVPIPHFLVKSPDQARAAVDSLARLGVDFVKIHNRLSRASYFAIAAEVKRRGWVFAGHLPDSVTIVEASDAGQRSLEHLFGFGSVCTDAERASLAPAHPAQGFIGRCASRDPTPDFEHLAANGTWVVPTLSVVYPVSRLPDTVLPNDSINRYRSKELERFQKLMFQLPTDLTPAAGEVGRRIFARRVALIGALERAGVRLMTGTDAPSIGVFPGFSLHDELALFVEGGVSPLEALRAATFEPARYFNALDSLGTVEPGKVADLVLLDGDPLLDIHNTRRIAAVVYDGHLLDAAARTRLLANAVAR